MKTKSPQAKEIGSRLIMLRISREIPQFKIAEMLGISAPSLSAWESGTAEANYNGLLFYSDFFNVSLDWILQGHPMPFPEDTAGLPKTEQPFTKDEVRELRELLKERKESKNE